MRNFVDNQGRSWSITLNVGEAKRVNGLLDVNILQLADGDPPLLTRLDTDIIFLANVLYAFCKTQADALKITDEDFGRALTGEPMLHAHDSLMEEFVDFFQQLQRTEMVAMIRKQLELVRQGIQAATRKIETIDAGAKVRTLLG